MQVPPSRWQATLFRGVRTLLTGHLVHYAGLLRKIPAFWEQEATIYHQENVGGREWGRYAQAVPELAGRVALVWIESPLSSALCSVTEALGAS